MITCEVPLGKRVTFSSIFSAPTNQLVSLRSGRLCRAAVPVVRILPRSPSFPATRSAAPSNGPRPAVVAPRDEFHIDLVAASAALRAVDHRPDVRILKRRIAMH